MLSNPLIIAQLPPSDTITDPPANAHSGPNEHEISDFGRKHSENVLFINEHRPAEYPD